MSVLPSDHRTAAPATGSDSECITLNNISWDEYVRLRDNEANWSKRMVYNGGELQIMSPSRVQERIAELISLLISEWARHSGQEILSSGSLTVRRKDVAKGAEPDRCFYIQNIAAVFGRDDLDLSRDPPPDLVIEVVATNPLGSKLAVYQSLGVPEVWVWCDDHFTLYRLNDAGDYAVVSSSLALPGCPIAKLEELLLRRNELMQSILLQQFREDLPASD